MTSSLRISTAVCFPLARRASLLRAASSTASSFAISPLIRLKQSKARLFQDVFVPLIYSNAIAKIEGQVSPGEDVRVVDEAGELIGRGFYNPHSLFRVRLVASRLDERLIDATLSDLLTHRFHSAAALRLACGLPSPGSTTGYRLVNSEGDYLSGLIIDIFGATAVIQSSSLWTEKYQNVLIESFREVFPDMHILWKRSSNFLRQDGCAIDKVDAEDARPDPSGDEAVVIMENGLKYRTLPGSSQKTGFYFDQRENRDWIGKLCSGKSLLDLYCFTGGFSLNALKNGCASVVAVDSSDKAIYRARENLLLNENLDPSKVEFIESDAEAFMQAAISRGEGYDVIVLDPPKLAPNADALAKAKKKYDRINRLAMQLIKPSGGWLFTCTCSGAMAQSPGTFERIIASAAQGAGRRAQIVAHRGAATDHPCLASMTENAYFKGCLVRVL